MGRRQATVFLLWFFEQRIGTSDNVFVLNDFLRNDNGFEDDEYDDQDVDMYNENTESENDDDDKDGMNNSIVGPTLSSVLGKERAYDEEEDVRDDEEQEMRMLRQSQRGEAPGNRFFEQRDIYILFSVYFMTTKFVSLGLHDNADFLAHYEIDPIDSLLLGKTFNEQVKRDNLEALLFSFEFFDLLNKHPHSFVVMESILRSEEYSQKRGGVNAPPVILLTDRWQKLRNQGDRSIIDISIEYIDYEKLMGVLQEYGNNEDRAFVEQQRQQTVSSEQIIQRVNNMIGRLQEEEDDLKRVFGILLLSHKPFLSTLVGWDLSYLLEFLLQTLLNETCSYSTFYIVVEELKEYGALPNLAQFFMQRVNVSRLAGTLLPAEAFGWEILNQQYSDTIVRSWFMACNFVPYNVLLYSLSRGPLDEKLYIIERLVTDVFPDWFLLFFQNVYHYRSQEELLSSETQDDSSSADEDSEEQSLDRYTVSDSVYQGQYLLYRNCYQQVVNLTKDTANLMLTDRASFTLGFLHFIDLMTQRMDALPSTATDSRQKIIDVLFTVWVKTQKQRLDQQMIKDGMSRIRNTAYLERFYTTEVLQKWQQLRPRMIGGASAVAKDQVRNLFQSYNLLPPSKTDAIKKAKSPK